MTWLSSNFGKSSSSNCIRYTRKQVILSLFGLVSLFTKVSSNTGGLPLSITFDPPADRVQLGEPLTVRCERTVQESEQQGSSIDGVSTLLHCPIAPWNSFCFLNCKSACAGDEQNKCPFLNDLGNVTCQTIVSQNGHIRYEYRIPRLTKRWLTRRDDQQPGFYCRSAGLKTPEVWLTVNKAPAIVNPIMPSPNSPRDPQPPAGHKPVTSLEQQPVVEQAKPSQNNHGSLSISSGDVKPAQPGTNEGWNTNLADETILIPKSDLDAKTAAITREILIVGAIVIAFISIMLNVFCCIRCALIRQYSKTKGPVHMQHLFCMAEEIHNARVGRLVRSGASGGGGGGGASCLLVDQWDQSKPDAYRFAQSTGDGSYASGSRILVGNPSITLEPYNSSNPGTGSVVHGSACGPNAIPMPGTFSDTNSNNTAGVDLYGRYLPDGRVATLQSGSAFSLVSGGGLHPNMNVGGGAVSASNPDRHSKTSSLIMVPAQQILPFWNASNMPKHLVTAVPTGYQVQSNQMDTGSSHVMSSDGVGSCLGSVGQADNSSMEPYQPSSSGISTLRRNSSSNKEPLLGPPELGNRTPPPTMKTAQVHLQNNPMPRDASSGPVNLAHVDNVLVIDRSQPMGSSQPQLSTAIIAKINNSNSNPQFAPVYTLLGTSISQSDSGTGSGSGHLHAADSQGVIKMHLNHSANSTPLTNGLRECDPANKIFARNHSNTSIHMYPHLSHKRRRGYVLTSHERRRARYKHRKETDCSTEDDVSDWSESIMEQVGSPEESTHRCKTLPDSSFLNGNLHANLQDA